MVLEDGGARSFTPPPNGIIQCVIYIISLQLSSGFSPLRQGGKMRKDVQRSHAALRH